VSWQGYTWCVLFQANTPQSFDGDMTFFLDSGLEIRVQNDQFMTPFVGINREGKRIVDRSQRELLLNPLSNQPATLGRYFLTAAYLMVNLDVDSFTLWQANPTTSTSLISVYDEETSRDCEKDASSPSQTASPTALPEENAQDQEQRGSEDSADQGMSPVLIGATAGGGAVLLLAVALLAFFHVRRKRRQHRYAAGAIAAWAAAPPPQYDHQGHQQTHKLPWQRDAQEVEGSAPGSYEIAGSAAPHHFELDTGDYGRRF
jgi:hypothetical protein